MSALSRVKVVELVEIDISYLEAIIASYVVNGWIGLKSERRSVESRRVAEQ